MRMRPKKNRDARLEKVSGLLAELDGGRVKLSPAFGEGRELFVELGCGKGAFARLYLNFSDPWPKKRNAKRRLTSPLFLERYKTILAPGGRIFFKTDNRPLFDYSLETFAASGYTLENVCFDLHGSPMAAENIMTEYERNFSAKGFAINYLEAFLK